MGSFCFELNASFLILDWRKHSVLVGSLSASPQKCDKQEDASNLSVNSGILQRPYVVAWVRFDWKLFIQSPTRGRVRLIEKPAGYRMALFPLSKFCLQSSCIAWSPGCRNISIEFSDAPSQCFHKTWLPRDGRNSLMLTFAYFHIYLHAYVCICACVCSFL